MNEVHYYSNVCIFLGTYKRSEDETFIDIGFDINGTKHLDASLGYSKKKFNHGYTYHPTAHLIINSERVAAVLGILLRTIVLIITQLSFMYIIN